MAEADGAASTVEIRTAQAGDDLAFLRMLFVEYAEAFEYDTCFADFDAELDGLPAPYLPPAGNLWLARVDDAIAGCVALKPVTDITDDTPAGEIKRLYVRPQYRGHRLGTRLIETVIAAARAAGHRRLVLDTVGSRMEQAVGLYTALGFVPHAPYHADAPAGVDFYRLDL